MTPKNSVHSQTAASARKNKEGFITSRLTLLANATRQKTRIKQETNLIEPCFSTLKWPCPAILIGIGYARVRGEVIRHLPAPIFIPRHKHSWPSVNPHIVFSDLPITNKTCNSGKTAFMATPYSVIRICSLAPIRMEITAHEREAALPIRIKISPVYGSSLRGTEINLSDIMNQFASLERCLKRFGCGNFGQLHINLRYIGM